MNKINKYIGARYIPLFGRKGEESIEWDNSAPYEPLTVVLYEGNSYTSRTYVPIGVDITNTDYWALSGNYNGQIEELIQALPNYNNTPKVIFLENGYNTELNLYALAIKFSKEHFSWSRVINANQFSKNLLRANKGFLVGMSPTSDYITNHIPHVPTNRRTIGYGFVYEMDNGEMGWVEDYLQQIDSVYLSNTLNPKMASVTYQPLILNGNLYDFNNIPNDAPERDYLLNNPNAHMVFGWDSDYYYFLFVDDRTPFSNGCNSTDLQTWVQNFNIENAIMMDGGGSTQLYNMPYGYNLAHIRAVESPDYSQPNMARKKTSSLFTVKE